MWTFVSLNSAICWPRWLTSVPSAFGQEAHSPIKLPDVSRSYYIILLLHNNNNFALSRRYNLEYQEIRCAENKHGWSVLASKPRWTLDVSVLVKSRSSVCHLTDGEYLLHCFSLLLSTSAYQTWPLQATVLRDLMHCSQPNWGLFTDIFVG